MRKYKKLSTLISSVFIGMSVPAYGDDPLSPKELENYVIDNAQAIVDAGEDRAALQREIQQLKTTVEQLTQALKKSIALTKAYADTKASQAEQAAKATANDARNRANNAQSTANDARNRANNAKSTANTAVSKANTTIHELAKQISFSGLGKMLEQDATDKVFFPASNCPKGRVRAAKAGSQAAICVCISGNHGKGWYCLH